jgi:hypothetical protein
MAGEGVNREVKLTLVVEGADEATQKIKDVISGLGSSKGESKTDTNKAAISSIDKESKDVAKALKELDNIIKEESKQKSNDFREVTKGIDTENREKNKLIKQLGEFDDSVKGTTKETNNMRSSLTGMLIWMHTFRVFGEYSKVLHSQFIMLGNAVGMIMNQLLIPLYPLIIGLTRLFYDLASVIGWVMKQLGKWPSLLVSAIAAGVTLAKLFGWLNWTVFGHRAAVDADTAALLAHTAALTGSTGSEVAGGVTGAGAGLGGAGVIASLGGFGAVLGTLIAAIGPWNEHDLGKQIATAVTGKGKQNNDPKIEEQMRLATEYYKNSQPHFFTNFFNNQWLPWMKSNAKFMEEHTLPFYNTVMDILKLIGSIMIDPFLKLAELPSEINKAITDIAKENGYATIRENGGPETVDFNAILPNLGTSIANKMMSQIKPAYQGQAPWAPTTPQLGQVTGTTSISDTEANRRYGQMNNPSAYTINFYGITDVNEIMRQFQQFFGGTKGIN